LVNIVDDWEEMEKYAINTQRWASRSYQILDIETRDKKKRVLVKVQVGKFGFEQDFLDRNDPLFQKIQDFCICGKFLNVSRNIPDEQFFQ
jgi:hypothetical protein